MAFVPGYDCDVFVSYATVDNQRDPGVDHGWVTPSSVEEVLKLNQMAVDVNAICKYNE